MREVFKAFLIFKVAAAFGAALLLNACGGGSSPEKIQQPSVDYIPVEPVLTADNLQLYGQLEATAASSIGFVVLTNDNQSLREINWQQTSGPDVIILAAHTQAIGFDTTTPGTYSFKVTATTSSGSVRSLSFTVNVTAQTDENMANIRLDHMATERGRISLRVDTVTRKIITSVQWEQLGGPEVEEIEYQSDTNGGPLQSVFFAAPQVSAESVMEFAVTLTFDDGTTAADTVLVGINDVTVSSNGIFTQSDMYLTTDMQPYISDSPWAQALEDCVYTNQLTDSCTFVKLPLIGMQTSAPDIQTILNKTLVSHPWMGDRFAEFLQHSTTSQDMLQLLRGVTAIVISYDIRPSFYWVRTGAIYLDARNFWRTPTERDTLNTAPDYRRNFGSELQFGIYWRYVKNDSYYYPQPTLPQSSRNSRDFTELEAALAWLMYHELAHANDFFPSTSWASMRENQTPLSYFQDNAPQSTRLYNEYPLESSVLTALADVSFGGETATAAQKLISPPEVADEFSADIAPSYYAYYTQREDYATLFEQFMMLYRLGVSADTGVIDLNDNPQALITWGQRNRVNLSTIQARTAYTAERVLPDLNVGQIQSELPETIQLKANESWYDFSALSANERLSPLRSSNTPEPNYMPLQWQQWDGHLRY